LFGFPGWEKVGRCPAGLGKSGGLLNHFGDRT
jgi:hypothetical protein